jgi:peptidoglycan/LPS O-acetylase OafA/YrhL
MRATAGKPAQGYMAGIDGLRGVACLMVMVAHLNLLDCGWFGVASLFVVSGFLITRVLFSDIEGTESLGACLKRFYIRRSLRIFPVYYLYLVLLLVVAAFVPVVDRNIDGQIGFAFFHVYNLFVLTGHHHYTHLLDHLWSMSVEEQFYLAWPLVVYFAGRKRLPWICLAILVVAPLIRWLTVAHWPPPLPIEFVPRAKVYFANYFSTLSHIDAFAYGALLNYVKVRPRAWWLPLSLAVSYLIAVPVQGWGILPGPRPWAAPFSFGYPLSLPEGYQYVWGYSVVYFNYALLIYAICHLPSVQKVFSHAVLDWLGKRAYPIYVFHYALLFAMTPLLITLKQWSGSGYVGSFLFMPLWFAVVFAVAHLVHERIEKPAFKLKDLFSTPLRAAPSIAGGGVNQPGQLAAAVDVELPVNPVQVVRNG